MDSRKTTLRKGSNIASPTHRPKRGRPRGTGSDSVYRSVRAQILNLTLAPGEDLDELKLVRQFKVSRTPVREALIRLSSEGLVAILPNVGARVASLSANEIPQILEAVELAERVTTRWAAIRRQPADIEAMRKACKAFTEASRLQNADSMGDANRAFHLAIANAAHNSLVASFHESLQSSSHRLSRLAFADAPTSDAEYRQYFAEVDQQHRRMLEAIEQRNAGLGDDLAKQHATLFRERIARFLRASLAADVPLLDPRAAAIGS
jgi:DNA-binding GntR family transcriptional regulator